MTRDFVTAQIFTQKWNKMDIVLKNIYVFQYFIRIHIRYVRNLLFKITRNRKKHRDFSTWTNALNT